MTFARLLRLLRSKRDLARLNHIFIPAKKEQRDRFRRSAVGRFIVPLFGAYGSLSREGRVMFLVTLMIGFAGLDVLQTQVHLLFAMLSGLIVASLAARPFFRARGLSVQVEAPQRVSVGEAQRFVVKLTNEGARTLPTVRVMAPFLPWDGTWLAFPDPVASVPRGGYSTTTAEARFLARGEHHLDAFEVGLLVPFGLAVGPRRASSGPKFLVVPKVAAVTSLALKHAAPSARDPRIVSMAQGDAEFSMVRPYRAGDPLKHLHARTWARTGVPHVRSFVAEKSERVGIAIAIDGPDAAEIEKEAALGLAAGLAAHAVRSGAGLAALIVDTGRFAVEPRTGHAALDAVLDRLGVHNTSEAVEPVEAVIEEAAPALSALVLVTADETPRRRALVERLSSLGVSVRWISVVPEGVEGAPPPGVTRVGAAAIERGEAIAL